MLLPDARTKLNGSFDRRGELFRLLSGNDRRNGDLRQRTGLLVNSQEGSLGSTFERKRYVKPVQKRNTVLRCNDKVGDFS